MTTVETSLRTTWKMGGLVEESSIYFCACRPLEEQTVAPDVQSLGSSREVMSRAQARVLPVGERGRNL